MAVIFLKLGLVAELLQLRHWQFTYHLKIEKTDNFASIIMDAGTTQINLRSALSKVRAFEYFKTIIAIVLINFQSRNLSSTIIKKR